LKERGLASTSVADADLIVVNGCTVTKRAETDIRRFVRRAKEANPRARVVLAGCHAQVYPERPFGADLVLGQKEKFEVERYFGTTAEARESTRDFPLEPCFLTGMPEDRTRFFLKVQDGCDRFCSYCIVPYARGKVRSRPVPEVVAAMERLKGFDIKEVVLTGIDLGSYRDQRTGADLQGLLGALETADTPARIRLSSVDPTCIDEGFVNNTFLASRKFMKSIHMPLQSGSDRILAAMNRRYTADTIRRIVESLCLQIPDIGIGMDVMVGFPGEDEAAFQETRALIDALDLYYLHVFPYSDREGTRAFRMPGKIPRSVKMERVREMKALDARKRASFAERFIGRTLSVLFEGKLYKGRYMRGYTESYVPVYVPYDKELENNLIDVTIKGVQQNVLMGER
jgi:threonylcarbamoyladenosine tRNA methylthiotransferase MtaB